MTTYTYSQAKLKLASVLETATRTGEVRIRGRDGRVFVVKPERPGKSPLDVRGVNLKLTRREIVDFVHEGRRAR